MTIQNSTVDAHGSAAFALVSALVKKLDTTARVAMVQEACTSLRAAIESPGVGIDNKIILEQALGLTQHLATND
jgi:hypothetical protein